MMKLKLSKNSIKFLNNLSEKEKLRIKQKLKYLIVNLNETGNIPFQELDIKTLTGDWKGYFRLRIGKIRIIFNLLYEQNELFVYEIDYRGNIYKKN
jgi:mRNA interferase RelE/StbE